MSFSNRTRKALLLDFDGTLADNLGAMRAAYAAFLAHFSAAPAAAEFNELNGPPLAEVVAALRERHGLPIGQEEGLTLYRRKIEAAHTELRPAHGASLLLTTAAANGWRVGVVTSNDRDRVAHWLEETGLAPGIEAIIGGEIRPGKPDPAPYLAALDRLSCAAAESLAIEDSRMGYDAAVAAGLPTLFYSPLDRAAAPTGAERLLSLPDAIDRLTAKRRSLPLRLAREADLPFLFALRNDPTVAAVSRTPRPLREDELLERFRLDPALHDKITMIAELEGENAAMVRFDRDDGAYAVSIAVQQRFRGQGCGILALRTAIDAFHAMRGPAPLTAEVAEDNQASIQLFQRSGFLIEGKSGRFLRLRRGEAAGGGAGA